MSQATNTYGVKFRLRISGTYTDVAEMTGVKIPKRTRKALEVTNSDSASAEAEYIKSKIKRREPFTIMTNYDPAHATQDVSTGLAAEVESDDASYVQFYFPSPISKTLTGQALVLSHDLKGDYPEGTWSSEFEFQPTGAWASASA